jgi:Peptidase family C25/FlgD Ig-like domain
MNRLIFLFFVLCTVVNSGWCTTYKFHVNTADIQNGYVYKKVRLEYHGQPQVKIASVQYLNHVTLPKGASVASPEALHVLTGMERKVTYASIAVPVFADGGNGTVNQLTDFTLEITEQPDNRIHSAAKTLADKDTSILATGTWYKIGITNTGFYKIDYKMITSMGVNPASINPAKIRIYGNGGHMLSENNAVVRPTDLLETAITVSASGSTFGSGDYILFYGQGTTNWTLQDTAKQRFVHQVNLYSDTAYYFVCFDFAETGSRITTAPSAGTPNIWVSSYNFYAHHELDLVNPVALGKFWYGEQFNALLGNTSQTFSFNAGSTIDSVFCTVSMGNLSDVPGSNYTVSVNGNMLGSYSFNNVTDVNNIMNYGTIAGWSKVGSSAVNVNVAFNPLDNNCISYLDYIEINARRALTLSSSDQFNFRDVASIGAGNVAAFTLQGANSSTVVYDVTNPQQPQIMTGVLAGGAFTFNRDAASLHEYAVVNNADYFAPVYVGKVPNQNLHGMPEASCIIITYPDFLEQANRLAKFHQQHDGLSVAVATTAQIYNEFSSGAQDISALRDFAKMFYDRAGNDSTLMPQYLILFGGASYDYKNRVPNNSNFVPVFESYQSFDALSSFSTDDFYSFLDDSENTENFALINAADIAVGRLPARSVQDATTLVDKVIGYSAPATLGPWRINALFVADNKDGAGDHTADAELMAGTVALTSKNLFNIAKDYIELLPVQSTPAGDRCPSASSAIDDQIFKGTFLVNYNGHGNTQVWAAERILSQDNYNKWQNINKLPFMVTATCDFGQFDQPTFVSAAEQLVLLPAGGAIVMLTTTEAVYAGYNAELNQPFLQYVFSRNSKGKWNTFGQDEVMGKNLTYGVKTFDMEKLINFRKFALLGDPAVTPDFPENIIVMDSIVDVAKGIATDSVKALGTYRIAGHVADINNTPLTNFSGVVDVAFYDKFHYVNTVNTTNRQFAIQDNLIYKGIASVTNGYFSVEFIVPKDISYNYGSGKLSIYAQNGATDAAGADSGVTVGGFSDNAVLNKQPPVVKPYINDSLFRDGGITGSNTSLFVILESQTGINVTGSSVGHDLKAVLDSNVEQPYILNDYYQTGLNTFKRGYVSFPMTGLANGKHNLKVTAWDVNNNTAEGEVNFVVLDGSVVGIENLGNFPNPFDNLTHFVFEHNHPNENLDVQIQIYSTSGTEVKKINESFTPTGSWSSDITWDGTDEHGVRLPSGVYVYRLNITTSKGFVSSAYQKLVIVR